MVDSLLRKIVTNNLTNSEKILITKKLGAEKFQNVVFKAEDIKFKVIKKICPNYLHYHDKYIDWQKKHKLKKLHSDYEKNIVIQNANIQKELSHKEFHREMNRNYHINYKRPLEIKEYLNWNKEVHKKNLKENFLLIAILSALALLGLPQALILIPLELFSAFINFQCVNIQNHNIYRLEAKEDKMKKVWLQQLQRNSKKYEEANSLVASKHEELQDVPSFDDIISSIKSKEQLEQLKKLIENQKAINNTIAKQKGKI